METSALFEKSDHPSHEVVRLTGTKPTQERRRTIKLMDTLPRGITIGQFKDGRKKSFFVRYGNPRKAEAFVTEVDRNDRAAALASTREQHGASALNYHPAEWQEFQAWKANKTPAFPIRDAVEKYMKLRLKEDLIEGSDHHGHVVVHLRRLVERFGDRDGATIKPDELREWLPSIISNKTGKVVGPVTQTNHRKDVSFFFERGIKEEWWPKNPCSVVQPPRRPVVEKIPLKPKEIFDLLHRNRNQPVIGKIALELFGGLRASSAARLVASDINFAEKGIAMPGVGHKSGTRKFRQGHHPVLWAWLEHAPATAWELKPKNYNRLKGIAFLLADVTNPGNVLRDSFASYFLALWKDMGRVGYMMQHKHRSTTEVYEGIATEADAKLVMAMTPAAVSVTWEEFLKSHPK